MKIKNRYCIGMHVQFYEIELLGESIDAIINACNEVDNKENITVDICFNTSQFIETIDTSKITKEQLEYRMIDEQITRLKDLGVTVQYKVHSDDSIFYNVGHYRRDLNYLNCENHDLIIWGEADCLLPKELFETLEQIDSYSRENNVNRYCLTFGVRKMWDSSWAVIEHNAFTNEQYVELDSMTWVNNPSSIWYSMSIDEMNNINSRASELDIRILNMPRFDGSGLVISSDLIKNGVNIPHECWFCGEDTAFQNMAKLIMGDQFVQYVVKNILKVHNRNHPKKREYVIGEVGKSTASKHRRQANPKWIELDKKAQSNLAMIGKHQTKFNTWK
jgi:hypothetical protein